MTRRGRVRLPAVLAAALLGAATTTAPLTAQNPVDFDETGGEGFEILGAIGLLTPLGSLVSNEDGVGATVNVNVSYGLDAVYWASSRWGVGATGWYSPAQLSIVGLPQGTEQPDLGNADYFVGALNAIYRFRGEGSRSPLEPYLAAGGGIRHLDVGGMAAPFVEDSTDPAATVAGGVRLQGVISKMMIRLEMRDNISLYESPATGDSKLLNDLLLSFGVGVRF
ncbi:MAG: hypothetical protein R3195_05720 [Gemmatimonadota bacterium]|nr:hypothetical protein [Gemmatimonadota bacterium]